MNFEYLRSFCLQLPGTTEDIKQDKTLCFLVGGKMFCLTGLEDAFTASLKVTEEAFGNLTTSPSISPAPSMARYKWVQIEKAHSLSAEEWERYILHSYLLVRRRLPAKTKKELNLW